jgi:hypothetical protein
MLCANEPCRHGIRFSSKKGTLEIVDVNVLYHALFELASPRRVLGALGRWAGFSPSEAAALINTCRLHGFRSGCPIRIDARSSRRHVFSSTRSPRLVIEITCGQDIADLDLQHATARRSMHHRVGAVLDCHTAVGVCASRTGDDVAGTRVLQAYGGNVRLGTHACIAHLLQDASSVE